MAGAVRTHMKSNRKSMLDLFLSLPMNEMLQLDGHKRRPLLKSATTLGRASVPLSMVERAAFAGDIEELERSI
jgi:hypothetical protein